MMTPFSPQNRETLTIRLSGTKCTMTTLIRKLRLFRNDTRGYVTIEALIAMPILLVLFATSWTFFDAFRQQSISQKANYTIGDMISRETLEIDDTYINSVQRLFYVMTRTGGTNDSDIRISLVRYDSHNDRYFLDWSEARGDPQPLNNGQLNNRFRDRLPVMAHMDRVILVETWDRYNPVFTFAEGLTAFDITTYSFTRPRYSPQIIRVESGDNAGWNPNDYNPVIPENEREGRRNDGNNGWGNGDQDAPGESGCTNNAENAGNCSNHDGENNTGGGSNTGSGDGGGNTGGGSNTGGNNNGGGNNNNGNNNNNNGNGNNGNYTPPPPPPPPPPAPPGGLR